MRRSLLVVVLVMITGLAAAQESPQTAGDWYLNQPIRDVTFVGLDSVPQADLRPIVQQYIGERFTERRFLELQRRLYALDFFVSILPEAVRPETGDGVIIQFTVEERPTVDEIRFNGNRRVRSTDLLDTVLLKTGDMITLAKRRADEQAVRDLYLERGFPDVTVSSRVEETATSRGTEHAVVFDITEGERVTIREIRFSGNTFASASTLRGRMQSKAQNIFNSGDYQTRLLEEDKILIEEYYRERGYVDAVVADITREVERDEEENRSYLILTVYVEEGEQYTFAGVTFEGNAIFSDEELGALIRVQEGNVLNIVRLQEGIAAVQDLYYQNGYIFNGFNVTEQRDRQALALAFTLTIQEQPRAHIENIIVRGNQKTLDYVITREIPLQVGDVFSVSRIREGIQNLTNLQFFSAINPETPQGSVEGLMDLIINVEEAQTANITGGVSFGGDGAFPIALTGGWSDPNFGGRGQTFGAQLQASPSDVLVSVNFLERWLAGERWSLGADFSFNVSTRRGVPQDILSPIFEGYDPYEFDGTRGDVPDPYEGYYVFGDQVGVDLYIADNSLAAGTYVVGDPFPEFATDLDIARYGLETDYEYAGGLSSIPAEYLMDFRKMSISIGGNTGYRFRTPLGTLAVGGSLRSSLSRNFHSAEQLWNEWILDNPYPVEARAFDPAVRDNFLGWRLENKLALSATLDRRLGLFLSPSSGTLARQAVTFTGGFLGGNQHYIRTDTTAEAYLTLFDLPVSELWNWKMVLALHSDISFMFPQFWVYGAQSRDERLVATDALLETNPMNIARGWDPATGGRVLWNNWVELRMPLVEQIVWLDMFADAVSLRTDPAQFFDELSNDRGSFASNMLYGVGAGFRFTIPQFPIRLYLVKRFEYTGGRFQRVPGQFFKRDESEGSLQGLDFVFAIGADFF